MDQNITGYVRLRIRDGILTHAARLERESRRRDSTVFGIENNDDLRLTECDFHTIGEQAFQNVQGYCWLYLSGDVTEIGEDAFRDCDNLLGVYHVNGLRKIGARAFRDSDLCRIEMGKVEQIGKEAFRHCRFTEVDLRGPVKNLEAGTFRGCYRLERIRLPEEMRSIGDLAFAECTVLTRLKLSRNLRTIGEAAFRQCSALASLSLPRNLRTIGEEAFCQCTALEGVDLSPALETIGDRAFAGCKQLAQVTLPAGLKRLGADVFLDCENMKTLSIPASVEECGLWQASGFRPKRITVRGSRIRHYGAAFAPLAGEVELCAPDVAVMDLPESVRTAAARGLLALEAEGTAIPPEKCASMMVWLKDQRMQVWREESMREALLEAEAWTFSEAQSLAAIAVEEGQIEAAARLQDYAVRLWKKKRSSS